MRAPPMCSTRECDRLGETVDVMTIAEVGTGGVVTYRVGRTALRKRKYRVKVIPEYDADGAGVAIVIRPPWWPWQRTQYFARISFDRQKVNSDVEYEVKLAERLAEAKSAVSKVNATRHR